MRSLDIWDSLSRLRRFGRFLLRHRSPSLSQEESPSVSPNPSNSPQPYLRRVQFSTTVSATTNAHPMYRFTRSGEPARISPLLPTERRETPVIGYRAWIIHWMGSRQGLLGSVAVHTVWKPGINMARCELPYSTPHGPGDETMPPNRLCHCGLHIVKDFGRVGELNNITNFRWPVAIGAVMGWGRVIQHGNEGCRVQYAQVVALLDYNSPTMAIDELVGLHQTAERYGVPLLKQDAFVRHAAEFGESLP